MHVFQSFGRSITKPVGTDTETEKRRDKTQVSLPPPPLASAAPEPMVTVANGHMVGLMLLKAPNFDVLPA